MMILVLDDDIGRHENFAKWIGVEQSAIVAARTYSEFVTALQGDKFDIVFLDHDLNDFEVVSAEYGMYGQHELTGQDAAYFMGTQLPVGRRPKHVIVHSWNSAGAIRMLDILREYGYTAVRCPFGNTINLAAG